ncbi:DUF6777 domain-containing protein [Streptomyces sp. NPDC058964]|uniref:DUF6777 domain-containing protein n=1 Tax=Streptomyces sp. NPDC058964 TaxID=3346681 RepID=UPI0036BF241A
MRIRTGTTVVACALSAALLVAGCAREGAEDTGPSAEVVLQPAEAQGPDPFTGSTATAAAAPARVTRAAQSAVPARNASVPLSGRRSISGGTPGLYGGTARVGSCDVERQIDYLAADPARGRAFAGVEGITRAAVPGYLRALTPVVLRSDTRVTDHGYRDGRATGFQSVLQAGTAVLVDNRGVPRVRCACGNPLKPPRASGGGSGTGGQPWSGYRPGEVVEVTPAPQVVSSFTVVDLGNHGWIERPIGHDVRHDHVVPPAESAAEPPSSPRPEPQETRPGAAPGRTGTVPGTAPAGCATPAQTGCATAAPVTVVPRDQLAPLVAAPPGTGLPDQGAATAMPQAPWFPDQPALTEPWIYPDTAEQTGPENVPQVPGLPDGEAPVPDDVTSVTGSIFDSPTVVFGG